MRKLQRHWKAVGDEIASLDQLLVQQQGLSCDEDERRLQQMRMDELVVAKKQLDVIICFASSAAKHGVTSGAFAKSVATEMHRMTLPPAIDPGDILPSCMRLAHFKCCLEECSHKDFWQRCRLQELQKFSLPSTETVEGVAADILGDKIAQYTKGAKGTADLKALEAWLEVDLWKGLLPPPLEQQMVAVERVVSLARKGNSATSLSLETIAEAIAIVSDSKFVVASTLQLYPEGRGLCEAAKREQASRTIVAEMQKRVLEVLKKSSMSALAKLQEIYVIVGTDASPCLHSSWTVETHDVQALWSKSVAEDVVEPWRTWDSKAGADEMHVIQKMKESCQSLLDMTKLVGSEHADEEFLKEGLRCCELVESIGGAFDVKNVHHLKSIEDVSSLHSSLDARWPRTLKNFLAQLCSENVAADVFASHKDSLEAALDDVAELVPDSWRRWGDEGSVH